ncbi:hypothetical protein SDC9_134445 [bioreactor metagenome]|uniref:Uncharacterized protein n=1 Tax=bioreactor metagenome TaxID=1076179 RepID=A0A645DDM8_9ZZZZ
MRIDIAGHINRIPQHSIAAGRQEVGAGARETRRTPPGEIRRLALREIVRCEYAGIPTHGRLNYLAIPIRITNHVCGRIPWGVFLLLSACMSDVQHSGVYIIQLDPQIRRGGRENRRGEAERNSGQYDSFASFERHSFPLLPE